MIYFFFQAEDGIRDFCLSRGLGDVYKRQVKDILDAKVLHRMECDADHMKETVEKIL